MLQSWSKRLLPVWGLLICMALLLPERASAGNVFDNAYDYFQSYGSGMSFQPGEHMEGMIYYGTKAKLASSTTSTRFETLGWRVTVKNSAGTVIDQIYYCMGGSYMTRKDAQEVDGYKYALYCVSLDNLKSRLSTAAGEALKQANCSIIFDACTVVVKNGVRQGGMTDAGIAWGTVYTTYEGIAGAQNWSKATKELLKTYYNKTIADMFFQVTLKKGTGIAQVQGAGKYCFGTEVTVDATPEEGYVFSGWSGSKSSTQKKYTFVLYENVSLTASAIQDLPPEIKATDIYVPLTDARNGVVSEQWIAAYAQAEDAEDGGIPYGRNANNGFYMLDFQPEDYTSFQKEGYVTQTFYAVDSGGNEVRKTIKVYLVDDTVYDTYRLLGEVRFLSGKYYKDNAGNWITQENGGLWSNSVWRIKKEYAEILDALF